MELQESEVKIIANYLSIILEEAKLDYSHCVDLAIVHINGENIIFDADKIKNLKSVLLKLKGEFNV